MTIGWPTSVFWSPRPPEAIQEDLEVNAHGFVGDVDEGSFTLTLSGRNKNSWRPISHGTFTAAGGGTLIEVTFKLHVVVLIFTLVHGAFLFGLSWLIGFFAFHAGVSQVRGAFRDTLGDGVLEGVDAMARAQAVELADPTAPGAEAGAPYTFRVQSTLESAVFTIRSPHGHTRMEVTTKGIALTGHVTATLGWDDLAGVVFGPTVTGTMLELAREQGEPVVIPCGWHTEAHLTWLADYLTARDARLEGSPEDRARAEADAARLGRVRARVPEPPR